MLFVCALNLQMKHGKPAFQKGPEATRYRRLGVRQKVLIMFDGSYNLSNQCFDSDKCSVVESYNLLQGKDKKNQQT